jgi:hypothetical protein
VSFTEQLLTVYKDDGVKGFYKGIIPSLILVSNPAVQFMVFERLKSFLMKRGNRKRLVQRRRGSGERGGRGGRERRGERGRAALQRLMSILTTASD